MTVGFVQVRLAQFMIPHNSPARNKLKFLWRATDCSICSAASFMKHSSFLRRCSDSFTDFRILLRSIPAPAVSLFILSVVCANLMANKELVSYKYLALDCGFAFSWIMFLCMDSICKSCRLPKFCYSFARAGNVGRVLRRRRLCRGNRN